MKVMTYEDCSFEGNFDMVVSIGGYSFEFEQGRVPYGFTEGTEVGLYQIWKGGINDCDQETTAYENSDPTCIGDVDKEYYFLVSNYGIDGIAVEDFRRAVGVAQKALNEFNRRDD